MSSSEEKIKKEIDDLIELATEIERNELEDLEKNKNDKNASTGTMISYQRFYTRSISLIKQAAIERYEEFVLQYEDKKRKQIDGVTYSISDYIRGVEVKNHYTGERSFNHFASFISKFRCQIAILMSVKEKIDSILSDIKGVLVAELFDDEISAAEELLKKGFLRPAGILAGVTLEKHLSQISLNHHLKLTKKSPSISDYNDSLKKNNIFDVPQWRFIQRLGDIRNLCGHAKEKEPSKEDVSDLISGVQKVVKSFY